MVFNSSNFCQCTIFALTKDSITVYGQNLDWYDPITDYVLINKPGVQKSILHWKGHWPAAKEDLREETVWKSKYGSVTFTYLGRDFIEGGMNEVGLTVDEASLWANYPPDDGRPGVSCGQWMQYQLDNFETVNEVIDHLPDIRPDGEGWHYLIADRMGNTCIIEYLNGMPTIYQEDSVRFPVLTNTTYTQAMSHIPIDKVFGGDIDIASGTDSYGRFVKAAAMIEDFKTRDVDIVKYAFHILSEVSNETTRRSVVYDSNSRKVLWKSENNTNLRWIDLNKIDFSINTVSLMVNADINKKGEINDHLKESDIKLMRELLFNKFKNPSQEVIKVLNERAYSLEEVLESIILHPIKYSIKK
jgi:penicillin V acylase-like amidase (Ntn superfamily)